MTLKEIRLASEEREMTSAKKILKKDSGFTLTEVTLSAGAGIVAVAYNVKSNRMPAVENFESLPAVELAFREEVALCGA